MGTTTFKTLKKSYALIIEQPVLYNERFDSGKNKGKVKSKRKIQYVKGLDTIFVDEQISVLGHIPDPTPIYISKGIITINDDEIHMIDLMNKHQDNKENGGTLFKLLDVEVEEIYQIGEYQALDNARKSISDADDNVIRALGLWFLGNAKLKDRVPTLRIALRKRAEQNPKLANGKHFVEELNNFIADKNNNEKLLITVALAEDILRIENGKTIVWGDSGEAIYTGSQATEIVRDFAIWVSTSEEGRQALKLITDKVGALQK